ncbi:MAG TPA: cupin domain-containing protein [Mesorhizobium sp.]|jgi:hypothetical protein|nr:cupin domain-containing protein [Mesorhizobium sp.]
MTAEEVIAALGLKPYPEGGFYAETFRDPLPWHTGVERPVSTAILFLLAEGQVSAWHRVTDAAEVWHFHAGAPLELEMAPPTGGATETLRLGVDLLTGERPQAVVPANCWQRAKSTGVWTLVGCTVSPGFVFERFEMAPPGWEP